MRLFQLISRNVLLLENLERLGNLGLDGTACSALNLVRHLGGRDGRLASVQVRFKVGTGLVFGGKVLVGVLVSVG